jgi:hypothetical protein
MTNKPRFTLRIPPLLYGRIIRLTGGTFDNYRIPYYVYTSLCSYETIHGYLYPFDPESRTNAVAHVEDRGCYTKGSVKSHSPTFSIEKYQRISYFSINQYVYTFCSEEHAKKAFEYVKNAYAEQLKAYESMMTTYYSEKEERFDKKINRKKARKAKVDSDPEKVSNREEKLKELQKKASN